MYISIWTLIYHIVTATQFEEDKQQLRICVMFVECHS